MWAKVRFLHGDNVSEPAAAWSRNASISRHNNNNILSAIVSACHYKIFSPPMNRGDTKKKFWTQTLVYKTLLFDLNIIAFRAEYLCR